MIQPTQYLASTDKIVQQYLWRWFKIFIWKVMPAIDLETIPPTFNSLLKYILNIISLVIIIIELSQYDLFILEWINRGKNKQTNKNIKII